MGATWLVLRLFETLTSCKQTNTLHSRVFLLVSKTGHKGSAKDLFNYRRLVQFSSRSFRPCRPEKHDVRLDSFKTHSFCGWVWPRAEVVSEMRWRGFTFEMLGDNARALLSFLRLPNLITKWFRKFLFLKVRSLVGCVVWLTVAYPGSGRYLWPLQITFRSS